jgi:anthranilate synthase component 1
MNSSTVTVQRLDITLPPFELYRRLRPSFRDSFILESAVGSSRTIAYSFLGFGPMDKLVCRDGAVQGGMGLDHLREDPGAFLRKIAEGFDIAYSRFPFIGGLVGYFSYEFAGRAEPSVRSLPSEFPEFELGMYRECLVYDHSNFQVYLISIGEQGPLGEVIGSMPEPAYRELKAGNIVPEQGRDRFEDGVRSIKERIAAGETFQTVLSRRVSTPYHGDLLNQYAALRELNPSPYMFYLQFDGRTVLGSSPETLLTVRGREATTFPIAGTRPLGAGRDRRRYREELLSDEKERAEHAMLVDLARNDISRVCDGGSVSVPEYMRVEEFSHVQHIVSKVQGTLRKDRSAMDALISVFPAGTVSGAPKPRSMEIISEIEEHGRGPYAGGIGYVSFNGNLDSAITIRSAFASDGRLYFQAGAGIVADSDPGREFEETEQKLGALRASLDRATGVGA